MGDAVLAFFGAPVAHEDDPERAVRAALDIVDQARRYGEQLQRERGIEGFAVRAGWCKLPTSDSGRCRRHKFKEEQDMSSKKLSERKMKEIEEIAAGWGKLLAREAFPDGPGLDVTLAEMEEVAARAARAVVRGSVETMTGQQAEQFDEELPCPTCGRLCPVKRKSRPVIVRGGKITLDEPVGHCPACRRDFFPSASGVGT
jgi:hypothetical protein